MALFNVCNFLKCKIGLTDIEQKHYSSFICRKTFTTHTHTHRGSERTSEKDIETQRMNIKPKRFIFTSTTFNILISFTLIHSWWRLQLLCRYVYFVFCKRNSCESKTKDFRGRKVGMKRSKKKISNYWRKPGEHCDTTKSERNGKQKASGNESRWTEKNNNIKRNGHVLFTLLSIFHLLFVTLNVHLNACLVFYFGFLVCVCICFSSPDRHLHAAAAFHSIFHFPLFPLTMRIR